MNITANFEHVYAGENLARRLTVTPEPADAGKRLHLAFRTPAGQLYLTEPLVPENGAFVYELPQCLLDAKGKLEVQLHVRGDNDYYAKGPVYAFEVERSLIGGAAPDGNGLVAISDLTEEVRTLRERIASISEIPAELVNAALSELQRQVDNALSDTSANPVENRVITAALARQRVYVDGFLSDASDHPAENRVITAALAGKADKTDAVIQNSVSIGRDPASTVGQRSAAAGDTVSAEGYASQAFGARTLASGNYASAQGSSSVAVGAASHAEGYSTRAGGANSHAEGSGTEAASSNSHAEGSGTRAAAGAAHAEGVQTSSQGTGSHAEGALSSALAYASHAEGAGTTASDYSAHAEGAGTTASGEKSHAEGYGAAASAEASHAEGYETAASGVAAHAEGFSTAASGVASHAEGQGTIALGPAQSVSGKYNAQDTNGVYARIVGCGASDADRKNAATLDWNGNVWFRGGVKTGGAHAGDAAAKTLATTEQLAAKADSASLAAVATSGRYADLTGKPAIPTVPANVSAFTNDAGYLTAHQSLAGLATVSEVTSMIAAAKQQVRDRYIVTATWNSGTDRITSIDIPPADWELGGGGKEFVLRLTDGVRILDLTSVCDTDFLLERRLFVGLLPSTSVLGNNNVIVNETEATPIPVYCFMGFDDADPAGNPDVFSAGQRTDGFYVWISKLYRMEIPEQADYVVEKGQTAKAGGTWRWRKWNSGLAECWASNYSFQTGAWSVYGAGSGYSYTYSDLDLPFTMADTDYTVSSVRSSGTSFFVIASGHTTKAKCRIAYALPTASTGDLTLYADLHVVGKWK